MTIRTKDKRLPLVLVKKALFQKRKTGVNVPVFLLLILIVVYSFLLTKTTWMTLIDNKLSDTLYQLGNNSSGKIVIIGIDDATCKELDLPQRWSRRNYAEVINRLSDAQHQPAVIGIDVLLESDNMLDPEGDLLLKEAAAQAENIILVSQLEETEVYDFSQTGHVQFKKIHTVHVPYDELMQVTENALDSISLDTADHVVRNYYAYTTVNGVAYFGFASAIVNKYATETGIELEQPKTETGLCHLSYVDGSGNYSKVSFLDVMNGEIDPAFFDSKIVLIGAYAQGLNDLYQTPLTGKMGIYMYGVEIHANAIDAMLNGYYKQTLREDIQIFVTFLVLLILGIIVCLIPIGYWIIILPIFCLMWTFLCQRLYESDRFALIVHPSWIPAGIILLILYGTLLFGYRKWNERKILYTQFGRYVDHKILKKIVSLDENDWSLHGEKVASAVMFIDVCGFTTISEMLTDYPELIVRLLNTYLDYASEIILRNGGTIDKYIGDAIMAFWGAPYNQPIEENIQQAVNASLEICNRKDELLACMRKTFESELSDETNRELAEALTNIIASFGAAIGIDAGITVIGNVGSKKRMDYTAIGDTVNTAARLENYKLPDTERSWKIYTSEHTVKYVEDHVNTRLLGEIGLKGKARTVIAYEITGGKTIDDLLAVMESL